VAWTSRVSEEDSDVSCEDVWRVWVAPASVIRELLVLGTTGRWHRGTLGARWRVRERT
jgi:hypothetical protein